MVGQSRDGSRPAVIPSRVPRSTSRSFNLPCQVGPTKLGDRLSHSGPRMCCHLERAQFLSPTFPCLSPTLRLSALALFGSAASGDPIIRERDLGSRLFFRLYYLSTRGRLHSDSLLPSPAPCAFLSMTSGILQVRSCGCVFCSLPSGSPCYYCRTPSHRLEGLLPLLPASGPTRAQVTM